MTAHDKNKIIALRNEADKFATEKLLCEGEYHPDFHTVSDERFYAIAFESGAASRDAEIADLLEANRIACEDLVEQQNLRVKYAGQIEELVAALEPFGAIDLVESRLPAEFAMLILRARAAIAKVKGLS